MFCEHSDVYHDCFQTLYDDKDHGPLYSGTSFNDLDLYLSQIKVTGLVE